ncbi:T9SS type A sorting domain-containing protein [Ignavibacterium album]|uniref:T9SS type A sorting domain-containing protein n=1 Tax=Ignavibacterium album TaxID=591197 RepID=UPI0038B3E810
MVTLVDEYREAGRYKVEFNVGQTISLSSGVYIYKLTAGSFTSSKKMMVIK